MTEPLQAGVSVEAVRDLILKHGEPANPRAAVTAAQAVVDALRAAPVLPDRGWRPIESAPRDGTEFQAWWSGTWQPRARFDPEYGSFQLWGRTDFDTEGWETYQIDGHWTPLPDAPAEGAE